MRENADIKLTGQLCPLIPHLLEIDWETVSLSLTAGEGRADIAIHLHLPCPPLSVLSCRLHYPIQSNCLPLFPSPALLNIYSIHILFLFTPFFISVYLVLINPHYRHWEKEWGLKCKSVWRGSFKVALHQGSDPWPLISTSSMKPFISAAHTVMHTHVPSMGT